MIVAHKIIRSKTNDDDFAKQTFCISVDPDGKLETGLVILKLVLTDKFESYDRLGFVNLKQFKDKRLYYQWFSIKLSTLESVANWISELSENCK